MRAEETFFRGYRRETLITGATVLCNAAGEKRLKLSMSLPLSGDQLVGMPSWVGEPFAIIAKPEYKVKSINCTTELDPMILHVFALPEGEKEIMTLHSVRLCSFRIERETDEEYPPIALNFSTYVPGTGKFLKFADDYFEKSIFIRYEAAQQSLLDDNPNQQPVDPAPLLMPPNGAASKPPSDDFEEDRKAANDSALDPEFEMPKPAAAARRAKRAPVEVGVQ
ncbi:MAG TPA: hypothetical protein VGP83_17145 [Pyrinomonadaceae bacterium]|jgi:hypothetical protein|nr:hypothetical protein [Pyrinomonadaceae bacterium]